MPEERGPESVVLSSGARRCVDTALYMLGAVDAQVSAQRWRKVRGVCARVQARRSLGQGGPLRVWWRGGEILWGGGGADVLF